MSETSDVDTFRVSCLPDCGFAAESDTEAALAESLEEHMWNAHRLSIDPLDAREMVVPAGSSAAD